MRDRIGHPLQSRLMLVSDATDDARYATHVVSPRAFLGDSTSGPMER